MLKKFLLSLFFCYCFTAQASADELVFKKLNIKQLKQIYDIYDYHGRKEYLMLPSYKYPAIILKHLPEDYGSLTDEKERNALFIKILAPIALKINQEIKSERQQLMKVNDNFYKDGKISKEEAKLLEDLAVKYDTFTRLKDDARIRLLLQNLLVKIEEIPPSLLIIAAVIETNWGTSRIVKEGNSLYKTLVWHTDEGLKPIGETEDDTYRIKIYPDIISSMREFAVSINSELKYESLRNLRKEFLHFDNVPFGTILSPHLIWKTPLQNYAGMFQYTLAYYELNVIDKSSLDSTISKEKLPQDLKALLM